MPLAADPGEAVQEEVDRGVATLIEQHTTWLELCAQGMRGEEYEWRSAELLSCLRSIEWDLQDLEDTVVIIEGNRPKFDIDDEQLSARKAFIDSMKAKIDSVKEEVTKSASGEGHREAAKGKKNPLSKYGKLKEEGEGGAAGAAGGACSSAPLPPAAEGGGDGGSRRPSWWPGWCCC